MKIRPFKNEPFTDFSKPANIELQKSALKAVKKKLGKTYEIIIDGKKIKTEKTFSSINPSDVSEVIAKFYKGTKALAEIAVESAYKTFQKWQYTQGF